MQRIKNYINQASKSRFAKDLGIVFSENIITKCLNFTIILILTRVLGPSDYGKYSFIFVTMAFCSAFFDFGMENTAVRFSNKEKGIKNTVFGLYFFTKFLIVSVVVLVLTFFGKEIFMLAGKQEITRYIPYLIIGLVGESLFFINDTYLQAVQKFKLRAVINISRYLVCLFYIVILFFKKIVLLKYVFYMYFIPLGISLFFTPKYIEFIKSYIQNKISKNLLAEIRDYEKWMFNLSISMNILSRIDFFMLSFWVSYVQIGIYNAAFQLCSIVSFLPYVFSKVMLPKMAELTDNEVFNLIRKITKPLIFVCIIVICFIPLTDIAVPFLLGDKYNESIIILKILLVGFLMSFMSVPFEQAFYSLGKPKLITIGRYLQILIIFILNIFTIPKYGIISAAINVLIARIIFLSTIGLLFLEQKKKFVQNNFNYTESGGNKK
ncbi:MAG: oligosaccharide flippase family protein [Candidatus Gastranaerophilales bacterium]|nr:oligosaccharide flippase family protein [Candidatus Gastranaerophilales bacterium]